MKKLICLLMVIFLIGLVSGCNQNSTNEILDADYRVYYLETDTVTLVTENYNTTETNVNKLVTELLEKMLMPDENDHISVLQGNFYIQEIVVDEKIAYIHFSDGYLDMNNVQEVLYRTAVVKTLGQIEGIDYVSFYVREQPLTNDAGNVVGLMSSSDFIENMNSSLEEVKWATLDLFYSDSIGQNLIIEEKEIAYKNNVSLEQAVIENLISGPTAESAKRTLPKGLKVLGVSVKDGICYVNLNSTFLDTIVDVSADVTIYSIVNSLCELPNIKKVQILVDGSAEKTFRDKYPLTTLFERNLNLLPPEE